MNGTDLGDDSESLASGVGAVPPLDLSTLLLLLAFVCFVVFLALEPLLTFTVFGSDSGEYYRLTSALYVSGHIPQGSAYIGWGFAYPDFPGIFLLTAATAGAVGTDVFTALTIVVPVVAVLSVLPLFLLFRRVFPNDTLALLGAGIATLVFPRMFSIAHPAPLSLGDFLVVAGLWMMVEGRRDFRWYLPLSVVAAALIITHHLSSYFFLVSGLGALLALELWRPGLWARRFPTRELVFFAGFLLALFAYWFYYAPSFLPVIAQVAPGLSAPSFALVAAGALLAIVVAALILRYRRRHYRPRGLWVVPMTDRVAAREATIIVTLLVVGLGAFLFIPLPGTNFSSTPSAVLFFTPAFALGVLAAGSRRMFTVSRLGPLILTLGVVLGLSAFLALVTNNAQSVIPAPRHAEYLFIPIGLMAAVGAGRLVARLGDVGGRRAFYAGITAVVLLLAANAAIVYPPQQYTQGFQEGLTPQDATLWMWVGIGIPGGAVVASDHRLSSMIFGVNGNRATWDSTPDLFVGSNWSAAAAELNLSDAPHTLPTGYPINAVAIDAVMYGGVALNPSDPALPLSPHAQAWFKLPPFVLLYENGLQVVYWVDGPVTEGS